MMAEEGHELEGKAPRAQHPALKIRSKIEIWIRKFCSDEIEEMKQHAAHRSARNDFPWDLENPSGVEVEEEREDKEPLSRRSFHRIKRIITKADSIWSRIDTARSSSLKEMRGEERS
jgi:hypothetical protein